MTDILFTNSLQVKNRFSRIPDAISMIIFSIKAIDVWTIFNRFLNQFR